jgi:hypothetical protein
MARRPRRQPEPLADLYDYLPERPLPKRPARDRDAPITVSDDWTGEVPVTDHEARIIEAFFADVLDELFGPLPR